MAAINLISSQPHIQTAKTVKSTDDVKTQQFTTDTDAVEKDNVVQHPAGSQVSTKKVITDRPGPGNVTQVLSPTGEIQKQTPGPHVVKSYEQHAQEQKNGEPTAILEINEA